MKTYTVEVMLRETHTVVTETLDLQVEPSAWTDADVQDVLEDILRTVHRVKHPDAGEDRTISLRGLSWIVDRFGDGVIIAIEIESGTVAAGPFEIAPDHLTSMIDRVMLDRVQSNRTIH